MRRLIYIIFSILVLSCSSNRSNKEEIIKPHRMQAVMMDLILSEALNYERSIKDSSFHLETENAKSNASVLKKHRISDTLYKQSCSYYMAHPEQLQLITDSIAAACNRMSIAIYNDTLKYKLNGSYLKNSSGKNGH
jgi:hypothetical protein